MVKHTQTIRRQIDNELFECVWPFCGIGAWRVKVTSDNLDESMNASKKKKVQTSLNVYFKKWK